MPNILQCLLLQLGRCHEVGGGEDLEFRHSRKWSAGDPVNFGDFFNLVAKKFDFDRVVGIDITQAMLDKVDLSYGNIELKLVDSSDIPFEGETFNVCTAYSFLHHLPTLTSTLKEVFRCLKKGGLFYADLEPNYYCWKVIDKLEVGEYSPILQREIDSISPALKLNLR